MTRTKRTTRSLIANLAVGVALMALWLAFVVTFLIHLSEVPS